jgi:hypothetical protein
VINDYIQPTAPKNQWAEFSTQGKINEVQKPIDKRGTTNNPIITRTGTGQNPLPTKANCTTPWGKTIKHGQFVKAYKASIGLLDLPCDVEIRACVNGNMKGSYTYGECKFYNTNYREYLKAGAPESNTGFIFFERIKWIFRREI